MILEKLLQKPNTKVLSLIFLITLTLSIIFMIVFNAILLPQFPQGSGLMDIKAAWNKENMDKIVAIWNANPAKNYIELMTVVNNIDYIFMICYGMALHSGLLLVTRRLEAKKNLQKYYLTASFIFPFFAVLFDVIEGINIGIMLTNPANIQNANAYGASLVASICMVFLYCGIIFCVIGLIISIISQTKKESK